MSDNLFPDVLTFLLPFLLLTILTLILLPTHPSDAPHLLPSIQHHKPMPVAYRQHSNSRFPISDTIPGPALNPALERLAAHVEQLCSQVDVLTLQTLAQSRVSDTLAATQQSQHVRVEFLRRKMMQLEDVLDALVDEKEARLAREEIEKRKGGVWRLQRVRGGDGAESVSTSVGINEEGDEERLFDPKVYGYDCCSGQGCGSFS
ncbi:uncharacterized protein SETTUDRAFT_42780 [Exserohilum turcica Et28A]|uniref:Uncharacterized protein n=1 Tax=Exserohilum turcicum (strain 28A) TaxID=671987 RepID=R0K3A9_EXST2|nr:uncharacterized protein SETTUDRAFT_42780 [Exserohilum turcica Et28A]EOA84064.1 hypothetical protein SETTUDRAFT_42780 [Exserohilum turcica Et28A]